MTKVNVFSAIQPLLVEAITKAIGSFPYSGPLCILRIYYYDTHAPSTYIDFRTVTESRRKKLLEEKGRDALFYLWGSGEECGDRPKVTIPSDPTKTDAKDQLGTMFAFIYELLCKDEERYMPRWRQALQSVSKQLNTRDWSSVCAVSDDFVIVPADGSQLFLDELDDLVQSIPPKRLQLLRDRGLLGPNENWERRPGFDAENM